MTKQKLFMPTVLPRIPYYGLIPAFVASCVLALAYLLGHRASIFWLALVTVGIVAYFLLTRPHLGLFAVILVALLLPMEFSTGTEVKINTATLLVPALAGVWVLLMLRRQRLTLAASRTNRPLALFLAASLLSLFVGRATWDPSVYVGGNFLLVQFAQWAIFAFSALSFWLTANLISDEVWLWRLTALFLFVGGGVAILSLLPNLKGAIHQISTVAFIRAPFWCLLAGIAGGQLLFNHRLSLAWRIFLWSIVTAVLVYAFVEQQEAASNWVGLLAVAGVLIWLRFPWLRWPLILLIVILIFMGVLIPAVYEFAGGDDEWFESGGSRMVLIERVTAVTLRNPITGLGPAAYRPYANSVPLLYARAFWTTPQVSSHNNYVDLFAHGGILGLVLLFWFAGELAMVGIQLRRRFAFGFAAGYLNGMLAVGAASLVIMTLADWILPFVYNIGFPGFQASVLVWLFLGGLVSLEHITDENLQNLSLQ